MLEETNNPFQSTESVAPSSGGSGIFIPIAIGLVGVILGGIALFLSLSGAGKSDETESALKAAIDETRALELKLNDIEQKLAKLESGASSQEQQLMVMASQTQSALNQVGQEINSTRLQVAASIEKINEIADKLKSASVPREPVQTELSSDERPAIDHYGDSSRPVLPDGSSVAKHSEHVIARGDTFAKLSKKYQVSVDEILAANPDADPRRLQVGQRIKIPHGSHSRE